MKAVLLVLSSVVLFGLSASADWGNGQDIQDQWRGGGTAYGGSGNPYSGGYDGGFYHGDHPGHYFGHGYHHHRRSHRHH